jgi:hypothetical protein
MGKRRIDQTPPPLRKRILLDVPVDIIGVLNAMADKKGISRNMVIVQLLARATKAKVKKGAE